MTDEELVARAIADHTSFDPTGFWDGMAAVVVAALRAAGRLVPEGCVAIDSERRRKLIVFARSKYASERRYSDVTLTDDDLDPEQVP